MQDECLHGDAPYSQFNVWVTSFGVIAVVEFGASIGEGESYL